MKRRRIVAIVEGQGEETAVPILIREWLTLNHLHDRWIVGDRAVCAKGQANLLAQSLPKKQRGIEYFVKAALAADPDFLLIVLDADDVCLERARAVAGHKEIGVVIADREFEAWFLHHRAAIATSCPTASPWEPTRRIEDIRDCKKVMGRLFGSYEPTVDQARFTRLLPLADGAASPSRSFRKLHKELGRLLG